MRARVRELQARLLPHGLLDVLRQVALFAVAYYGYRIVRGALDDPNATAVAFQHGRDLIGIERSLNVFVEPAINTWAQGIGVVTAATSWIYLNAQFSVTIGALVFLYLRHNDSFYFIRNMFMVAMAIALVGYIVFPTAPPRFFPEWGFIDSVSEFTGVGHDSVAVNALFNPYAAVPSMHVAFSLMIGIPLARLCRWRIAKVFWACYPLLVTFVIVATANHFISDAVLGLLTAAAAAFAATQLAKVRPQAWAFDRNSPSTVQA
jgi:membrane-associated phospholipid phosphatase